MYRTTGRILTSMSQQNVCCFIIKMICVKIRIILLKLTVKMDVDRVGCMHMFNLHVHTNNLTI